jgi:hypothetical protein
MAKWSAFSSPMSIIGNVCDISVIHVEERPNFARHYRDKLRACKCECYPAKDG